MISSTAVRLSRATAKTVTFRAFAASASSNWSNALSFASPESDFSSSAMTSATTTTTPQSASIHVLPPVPEHMKETWSHALSFASPESDFVGMVQPKAEHRALLPRTLKDALHQYRDKALVITTATAPHTIVYVNKTWEDMCGYDKQTVLHQPIGRLLHGPRTNVEIARSIPRQLLDEAQQAVDAYLINYKASGEAFLNHLTAGPLFLDDEQQAKKRPQFLVGILEEVSQDQVPLRMAV